MNTRLEGEDAMRATYHEELHAISDGLATTALLDTDLQLAENVISADRKVHPCGRRPAPTGVQP
ncbi:hypothetical protein [Streptomyces sp. NBC_00631]|uniref:hypothetical protein n=1 Tax=Streptomyces sp. NBC_00631 TaxID=2975793 RepID=UPI003864AF72